MFLCVFLCVYVCELEEREKRKRKSRRRMTENKWNDEDKLESETPGEKGEKRHWVKRQPLCVYVYV